MPRYGMECPKCASTWEHWEGFNDAPQLDCPECGAEGKRTLGSVLIKSMNVHTMDPLERQMMRENKLDIEKSHNEAIAAGRDPDEVIRFTVPKNTGVPSELKPNV